MTPERWQQVNDLFTAVVELGPEDCAAFLDQACAGDQNLRAEVESLLSSERRGWDLIERPALEVAAPLLANDQPQLTPGQTFSHYEIVGLIGKGGMGEVYLAADKLLNRRVALKLVPADYAGDAARLRRFQQEAQTASALNHPNILTIHEIGQAGNQRFIATEFVDGETLRQRLNRAPLTLPETVEISIQIASALSAAHHAGIIHRDIKPENIMLRPDGYVKVLDFGLAKLVERSPQTRRLSEASTAHPDTQPGVLVGTVKYMSPEQLREMPLDERTDIWSLGVLLHEMVNRVTPFEGATTNDSIALILAKEPPDLIFPEHVPAAYQALIRKALAKDRSDRHESAKALTGELMELLRELRREHEADDSTHPFTPARLKPEPAGRRRETVAGNTTSLKSVPKAGAGFVLAEIKQHKLAVLLTCLSAIVLLVIFWPKLSGLINRTFRPAAQVRSAAAMNILPLTNSGSSVCAAISPDGKSVAHVEKRKGMQELLITGIATQGHSVVVPASDGDYLGVTFSPDGNYLYFPRRERNGMAILYQVSLPGGSPRKIMEGVDSAISFSPNGDRFAFVRSDAATREYSLVIANIDGSEQTTVATGQDANSSSIAPSWSPNGKSIVYAVGSWDKGYHTHLVEFDIQKGEQKTMAGRDWYAVLHLAWLPDGSGLLVCAKEAALAPIQLWRVVYPQGESVKLTSDAIDYESVSASHDGNTLVAVQSYEVAKLWVSSEGDAGQSREIASTVGYMWYGVNWTREGKIVFTSMIGQHLNISLIEANGLGTKPLTANAGDNWTPVASSDGNYIVFASNRNGSLNIWRVNAADGSEPRQLTFSDGNSYPSISPDSRWVLYDNQSNNTFTVWKVSIDGGEPVQLTDQYTRMPVVSPDSQFFAARYMAEGGQREIAIFPLSARQPVQRLPIPIREWQRIQWTPDGHALTYIDRVDGVSNIWSYDLISRQSRQLTNFKTDEIMFAYAWSADFKQLACHRGTDVRDVMIMNYSN